VLRYLLIYIEEQKEKIVIDGKDRIKTDIGAYEILTLKIYPDLS